MKKTTRKKKQTSGLLFADGTFISEKDLRKEFDRQRKETKKLERFFKNALDGVDHNDKDAVFTALLSASLSEVQKGEV